MNLADHYRGPARLLIGDDAPALEVSCEIFVHEPMLEAEAMGADAETVGPDRDLVPGVKEISGQVIGLSPNQLWELQDRDVTLILPDGRKAIVNLDAFDGHIVRNRSGPALA